ncbi:hypothetical protein G8770_03245 [Aestuariicella hydrocarbonica]|uniref:Uncharacterized protein n=1 Tax=Pseudomaricurvus hydrocarbonicus TaxID=1470433 RepID=A0A9E5JYM6_9GAMM|nr:hypothetical protein [Aestuariicella hydrocarbonica]NHO64562.1 hypothetical protein [Aestuariicella hydrocarbonica]
MKTNQLSIPGLILSILLLSACGAPKTPQAVTEAFWQAVVSSDADTVVALSTLTDVEGFDGFGRDWQGFEASWGRVVIEDDRASVVSTLSRVTQVREERRELVTYLVRREDAWRVDYVRTGRQLTGGELGALFGRIGEAISERFEASRQEAEPEVERLSQQLQVMSESFEQQATEAIEDYSEQLSEYLEAFADSVEQVLDDKEAQLSRREKQQLEQVVTGLRDSGERLDEPSLDAIAEGGMAAGMAQSQLALLDERVVGEYLQEWRELSEALAENMQAFFDDLRGTGRP